MFDEPLDLPAGTEGFVRIEPVEDKTMSAANGDEFENLPFFGMWADREDMIDGVSRSAY